MKTPMPDKNLDIIERIRNAYHDLTAAERKVADYVLEADSQVQFMSITQLAEECGVADATVSRFCRTLELKGFNAFKLEIAKRAAPRSVPDSSLPANSPASRRAEVCRLAEDAVHQTMELLSINHVEQAVELFEHAPRVVCLGSGGSMILAHACANLFSTVTNNFIAVPDSHSQISMAAALTTQDVIVLFSYSGSTTIGVQILELAKSRGVKTVLVTRYIKSPAAKLADVVLCCGSNETPFQAGSVPAKIAQLVVMDTLYQEYCHRNREACDRQIQSLASALSGTHL